MPAKSSKSSSYEGQGRGRTPINLLVINNRERNKADEHILTVGVGDCLDAATEFSGLLQVQVVRQGTYCLVSCGIESA